MNFNMRFLSTLLNPKYKLYMSGSVITTVPFTVFLKDNLTKEEREHFIKVADKSEAKKFTDKEYIDNLAFGMDNFLADWGDLKDLDWLIHVEYDCGITDEKLTDEYFNIALILKKEGIDGFNKYVSSKDREYKKTYFPELRNLLTNQQKTPAID